MEKVLKVLIVQPWFKFLIIIINIALETQEIKKKFFKKRVKIKNIKKNDRFLERSCHYSIVKKVKLIHAYGPTKKVVIMDIKRTIERIKRTANLEVTSIRRI